MPSCVQSPKITERLKAQPYFNLFVEKESTDIASSLYEIKFKKGESLFRAYYPRERIYLLETGLVRIEAYDETAEFHFVDYYNEQQLFPCEGLFVDDVYSYDAYAVTDIVAYYIPTVVFERNLEKNMTQMKLINKQLSERLTRYQLRMQHCLVLSATTRVIETLNYLKIQLGKPVANQRIMIPYSLSLKEIASVSGTTRETTGQVIKRLKAERKLSYQRKILIFY